MSNFGIGYAVKEMQDGRKVARAGWNGKDMFLYYVPENSYPAQTEIAKNYWRDKQTDLQAENEARPIMVPYGAYVAMKTAQGNVVPWLCSQTDLLATDWQVVP